MSQSDKDGREMIEQAFQAAFGNEELLFQIVDLFPIPIEIFKANGDNAFITTRLYQGQSDISKAREYIENPLAGGFQNGKSGKGSRPESIPFCTVV
jgi:hypothetical protein